MIAYDNFDDKSFLKYVRGVLIYIHKVHENDELILRLNKIINAKTSNNTDTVIRR